jgi:hypothetical protein
MTLTPANKRKITKIKALSELAEIAFWQRKICGSSEGF